MPLDGRQVEQFSTTSKAPVFPSLYYQLCELRSFLTPKNRWTQGAFARDEYGRGVKYHDAHAVSFCLAGAIRRNALDEHDLTIDIARALGTKIVWSLPKINDMLLKTHSELQEVLDKAILKSLKVIRQEDGNYEYIS